MREAWARWVRFTGREIDSRPLVLVRILLPLVVLGDLVDLWVRGAAPAVLFSAAHGGINAHFSPQLLLDGDRWWTGPALAVTMAVACPLVSAGVAARPALVALLLSSASFGHFYVPGDRAIDRLIRTALVVLLCSAVSRRRVPARIAAWPVDLLKWLLVLIYLAAGLAKIGGSPGWGVPGYDPELYRIFADPLAGRLDPWAWRGWWPVFYAGSVATVALELAAPLILTRHAWKWAIPGALMHLGIFAGMYLGAFSFGMLAFYPLLCAPQLERMLDRFGVKLGVDADVAAGVDGDGVRRPGA